MKKIIDFIYKTQFTKFVASMLIIGLSLVMCMNVILRYFFHFSFNWGDEILRYMNIYMAFAAIAAGWRYNKHISITVITEHLIPEKGRKYFRLAADLASIFFMLVLIYFGIILVSKISAQGQVSPALRLPMAVIYAAVPICSVISILQILLSIFKGKTYLESRE